MTLPPAMHAVLQAMATTSNTAAPPAALPLGLQSLMQDASLGQAASAAAAAASARDSQPPAMQHLQRLLASAPKAVVEQLQQQHLQQQLQQQQGAQPTLLQAADTPQQQPKGPPLRSGSFGQQQTGSPLEGHPAGLGGGSGSGVDLAWLNSQPFPPKVAPAADLAQALAALVAQPRQLAQLVTQLSQQVQRAEQAGQPNSEALRRVCSLLSTMAGPELGGATLAHQTEGAGVQGTLQRSAPSQPPDGTGNPSLVPPVSPPTSAAQAVASARAFLRSLSQSSSGQGAAEAGRGSASSPTGKGTGVGSPFPQQEQLQPSRDGAPHAFSVLLAAAEAGVPSPKGLPPAYALATAAASPSMPGKTQLGSELESAIIAFVQQAVTNAQQQSVGLELARRVRTAVERLEAERAVELVDPAAPGAKRQRAP